MRVSELALKIEEGKEHGTRNISILSVGRRGEHTAQPSKENGFNAHRWGRIICHTPIKLGLPKKKGPKTRALMLL